MKKRIFAIDNERDIREILKVNLEKEGYLVDVFPSGETAFKHLTQIHPDLIILDIMMTGMDGFEFCKKLRAIDDYKRIPVVFLSAKSEEFDKILGLELGGDDYITKPFSIKELKSRVKAIIRRTASSSPAGEVKKIAYKGLELYPDHYSVKIDSVDIDLTRTEFGILELFLRNPGKIFTRDNIIDSIKGRDVYVVDRTVDVHIMNLRKKLGRYKDIIRTFSGVGYGFKE
jgi:DNA-binding response OmpR family regulator